MSLPFVKMIFDVIGEKASVHEAATLLLHYEEENGVYLWRQLDDNSILGAGLFVPRTQEKQTPLNLIMELLIDWEKFDEFFEYSSGDEFETSILFSFLSSTQLIVSGMDFTNDHFIQYRQGQIAAFTQRAWADMLAQWATSVDWGPYFHDDGQKGSWTYELFYAVNDQMIENYSLWKNTVLEVIRYKTMWMLNAKG